MGNGGKSFWKRLLRLLPKKQIYIEGSMDREAFPPAEILEGEAGPVKTYFDADCPYEIVEREISPTRLVCPVCGAPVLGGLDYCNRCGAKQE